MTIALPVPSRLHPASDDPSRACPRCVPIMSRQFEFDGRSAAPEVRIRLAPPANGTLEIRSAARAAEQSQVGIAAQIRVRHSWHELAYGATVNNREGSSPGANNT